ncbi:MAG: UDP-2,4-diacetamido-2,4,6-trideoxy-beta-L-altropyranose hydrolase [Bacteroidetes bacterium]|nr:MAG: UDP-2,4-diacetamido-2,4,6-trideoxy-beta-L-altropyranose hydrolase [Bacteroidota bacterium]
MNNTKGRIIFRADGNSQMGLGHIVRCGALSESIGNEFERILYTCCNLPAVLTEANKNFTAINLLSEETDLSAEAKKITSEIRVSDIVVLDGYHFREEYQEILRSTGASIVCIDDIHEYFFNADVIINSAGGITPMDYNALPGTLFYFGPQYSLLRKPFLKEAGKGKLREKNRKIFICLGGADPENRTLEVVKFIASLKKFEELRIVTGGGYQFADELNQYLKGNGLKASVGTSLNAEAMASEMLSCSYAVCSPSTVCFEYMTIGGIVYLEQIATNQDDMIRFLTREGFAFQLKDAEKENEIAEQKSLEKQAAVFDGKASDRLKKIVEQIFLSQQFVVRKVLAGDMMLCYEWINEPAVREQSYNNNAIPLSDHEKWFASKLEDPNSYYYILELDAKPMAQIRFQVSGNEAVLGYLVDKNYRNVGLGTTILSKGITAFTDDYKKVISITGFVKEANIASQKSFEKLKFKKEAAKEYAASYKYIMQYDGH